MYFLSLSDRQRQRLTGLGLTMHLTYVPHHVTFMIEVMLAQGAGEGLLPSVTPHVYLQCGWPLKALATHIALVDACIAMAMPWVCG